MKREKRKGGTSLLDGRPLSFPFRPSSDLTGPVPLDFPLASLFAATQMRVFLLEAPESPADGPVGRKGHVGESDEDRRHVRMARQAIARHVEPILAHEFVDLLLAALLSASGSNGLQHFCLETHGVFLPERLPGSLTEVSILLLHEKSIPSSGIAKAPARAGAFV